MGTWYLIDKKNDKWVFEDEYIALKNEKIKQLEQENADLKNQLAETRTLNRDEVENILRNYHLSAQEKLDEICKLALLPGVDQTA